MLVFPAVPPPILFFLSIFMDLPVSFAAAFAFLKTPIKSEI
jgi:hypothetical protein